MRYLKERVFVALAVFTTIPWLISFFIGIKYVPHVEAFVAGIAVVGAAFLLSWAAETAEMDVPRSLSLAVVALLAVLPEYAVDMYFAWMAGKVGGDYIHYAAANMTGANRLLLGVGWSLVAFVAMLKMRRKEISLDEGIRLEFFILLVASLYCFLIPLRGKILLIDSVVLIFLYALYVKLALKAPREEFEPAGVPAYFCNLPTRKRRVSVVILMLYAALIIFISVEAFAEGLIKTAENFGIDEFLMVQWIAPLASESPEFIVAMYLVRKLRVTAGINALVSSKVNQWTLLIGCLVIVYSIALAYPSDLPLDARQREEVLLTAAQSLLGVAIIIDLRLSFYEAALLLFLFLLQFVYQGVEMRLFLSFLYLAIAVPIILRNLKEVKKSYEFVRTLARR
ncbi:sodium:calcium antiporter [Ferroglobus sp.]|uniref:sodium:calcium antiporter n=1 Tax=Ferroglobus sp. TaxID=2614230 RepID=UPI0025C5D3BA|nr:sodium:calcium antiporter [Ferroglobus sp.]